MLDLTPIEPAAHYERSGRSNVSKGALRRVCVPEILISLMLAREAVDGIVRQGVVMAVKNAFYAQSGGVTAVINGSACGVRLARSMPAGMASSAP